MKCILMNKNTTILLLEYNTKYNTIEKIYDIYNIKYGMTPLMYATELGNIDIVNELLDFGAKDFYYKLMKTLGDAYLYSKTGYLDAPWKKALASKLSSYSLYPMMEELQKSELNGLFREDLFFTSLTKAFFDSGRTPAGITPSTSSKRTPVGVA